MALDEYRKISRRQYLTDFSFLNGGEQFPTAEMVGRASVYKFRMKEYSGEYAFNKRLIGRVDGVEQPLPYKVISTNYFRLMTSKMCDLVFNNDISVKTGDAETDRIVARLIDETNYVNSIRKAFKLSVTMGDVYLKVHKNGVSVVSPDRAVLVVDKSNIEDIKAVVLFETIERNNMNYIRFEIHMRGKIYELVKQYNNASVGEAVTFTYKGRTIEKTGNWYDTGIQDCMLVQKCSINTEEDGLYGTSIYQDIQSIVFALEQRISVESHLLDTGLNPFLVVGMDMVETYEDNDGNEHKRLKIIDGNFLISYDGDSSVKPVELTYNLDNSNEFIGILKEQLYELSEMGKTFLSGEYTGNISEESLNNIIKSAIDKGNRLITEVYASFRDALYCLCRLNGIEVRKSDINIVFNIGRTDDDMKIAEISEKLISNGILSKKTVRERYFGFNAEQSEVEDELIRKESEPNVQHYDNIDKNNDNLIEGESNEDT